MVVHELVSRISEGPRDPVQLLLVASLLRDDAPWIYELALEAYRAVRSGRRDDRQKAIRRFIDAHGYDAVPCERDDSAKSPGWRPSIKK